MQKEARTIVIGGGLGARTLGVGVITSAWVLKNAISFLTIAALDCLCKQRVILIIRSKEVTWLCFLCSEIAVNVKGQLREQQWPYSHFSLEFGSFTASFPSRSWKSEIPSNLILISKTVCYQKLWTLCANKGSCSYWYQNLNMMCKLHNLLSLLQLKNVCVKSYRSDVRNQVDAYFFSSERPSRRICCLPFSADYVYVSTKMFYI